MRDILLPMLLAVPVFAQGPFVSAALAQSMVESGSAGAVVRAEAQTLRASCDGGDARIEGNHNTVVLTGNCRSLLLKGLANTVAIDLRAGAAVRVEGSGNRVTYQSAGPGAVVETYGPDNLVVAGPLPAGPPAIPKASPPPVAVPTPLPPPAPPATVVPAAPAAAVVLAPITGLMALEGADRSLDVDCKGRDVSVAGLRSAYVLRGGCKSVVVHGDLITVQAELQPGAHVQVIGRGDSLLWALPQHGAAPVVQVRGDSSRVRRADTIGGQPVR